MAYWCDDAIITLNQAMRFTNGFGITWNSGERVQTFTHPLWFLLLSFYCCFTEAYYLTLLLMSFFCSLAAFFLVAALGIQLGNMLLSIYLLSLMLCIAPVMEFTTSGLESPLAYLLSAGLVMSLVHLESSQLSPGRLARLTPAIMMSGLVMTRFDYVLIVGPIMLFWLLCDRDAFVARTAIIVTPVICWLFFSLFYFGLLFPCPYYAKIADDLPRSVYLLQGLRYIQHEIVHSPITFVVIAIGLACGMFRDGMTRALSVGIAVYLLYVLKIGGDWMAGRMFAVPVFLCCLLIALMCARYSLSKIMLVMVPIHFLLFFLTIAPTLSSGYSDRKMIHGIVNNRGFVYAENGLLSSGRAGWPPIAPPTGEMPKEYVISGLAGLFGLGLPDSVYHIDNLSLCSPMKAFMPVDWYARPGHIVRFSPNHLGESMVITGGEKWLGVPELEPLFNDIVLATHRPLLSRERLRAVWRLNRRRNLYAYNPNGEGPLYNPVFATNYPVVRSYDIMNIVDLPLGTPFHHGLYTWFAKNGLHVALDEATEVNYLQFTIFTEKKLLIQFMNKGAEIKQFDTYEFGSHYSEHRGRYAFRHECAFEETYVIDQIIVYGAENQTTIMGNLTVKYDPRIKSNRYDVFAAVIKDEYKAPLEPYLAHSTDTN